MRISSSLFCLHGLCLSLALLLIPPGYAERIQDLTTLQGVRSNSLLGYGLVVGLDGTGDQTMQTPFTTQSLNNMLSQLGITVPNGTNMQLKNVAAVMVTADLPPFARAGEKIDVVVSSMGNAKSLRGGTLLMTPLKGVDNQIYALAQGNLLVSGAGAQSGGSQVQVNQLNGARISDGATVEREVPTQFGLENVLRLQLKEEDFTLAQRISDEINHHFGGGIAMAENARVIKLFAPSDNTEKVRFISRIQNLSVKTGPREARIVVNSRTGSVVINRHVTLEACAVAQGDLTVEISRSNQVSQPDTPLAGGETVVVPDTQVSLREQSGALQKVNTSADLNAVIRALNGLGATPNDLMSILQSMKSAGCLRAQLEMN
ncbi:flagellar basal body P-ring protein FlgI [Mixta hanseatica]|uniref:Flagellar P-ring protein n=1 Tax=Mixta hanseatica TaxID=2872648 RepID=A0ABY4R941_9GAMM|nr:flagellar basal body P-ring protein FlgI [Mixta hanseatica]UQY44172.1 flagellar basal body P-ring protein FlgI [Mixta hanseatica]